MLKGTGVSEGIGIGKAVIFRQTVLDVDKRSITSVQNEQQRFLRAVNTFVSELEEAQTAVEQKIGAAEAMILGAQIAIVQDQDLIDEVLRTIKRQKINAEYVFHLICNGYITLFSNMEDELISARAADFKDIRDRMVRILTGIRNQDLSTIPPGSILVAEDIPPSNAASMDPERIAGILTSKGARFSHISIIARALRMPAVVGVKDLFDAVQGGETLILDAYGGDIWVNPTKSTLSRYSLQLADEHLQIEKLERFRDKDTLTADNKRIRLGANLAIGHELPVIQEANADGIGLYRTEFLFMDRQTPPTETEQYEAYRRIVDAMQGKPVAIRTLDIGGDKDIPCLRIERENNPFLGHRAIRFCLDRPDIFKVQLAAILRAAMHGNVRITLPMISCISELRAVYTLLDEVAGELQEREIPFKNQVPVGIMIETPATAVCARDLAQECDYFSIGTNDLTQYVLAVDRGNSHVARLFNPLHPAVLRLIAATVESARHAGIPVSVCGESASDPIMIPFLLGLGVDELSVNSQALLGVRRLIRQISQAQWSRYIPEILEFSTPHEIHRFITERMKEETLETSGAPPS